MHALRLLSDILIFFQAYEKILAQEFYIKCTKQSD